MLDVVLAVLAILLVAIVLWDAFETVVLPRRVNREIRLTSYFYSITWTPWAAVGRRIRGRWRETYLGFYGPLSLIVLLVVWATLLIIGFATLHWSIGNLADSSGSSANYWTDLYMSGSTFFTLGLGDVNPDSTVSRIITVVEAGHGFAFLALVISYLPVLYQAFSQREREVALLDARAGSPPSAGEFFRRLGWGRRNDLLPDVLENWERWAADVLDSHLSYPVLSAYRSQHDNQSWLAALTTILDISSLVMTGFVDHTHAKESARLTFAMARHAAVDIGQIFGTDPRGRNVERLSHEDFVRLAEILGRSNLPADMEERLRELRNQYEPYVSVISEWLLMPLPGWLPAGKRDAWEYTAWDEPG